MHANNFQLIIFDCDGVLVDSESISNRVVAEMLTDIGLPMSAQEAVDAFSGTSFTYIRQYFADKTGKEAPIDLEARFRKRSNMAFAAELRAIQGVEAAIQQIDLKRCVGSNGPQEKIRFNLGVTKLLHYFDPHIFSAYDLKKWKPAPDLYLHAAREMGVAPANCIVVEDSASGAKAGKAAGMTVLGYDVEGKGEALRAEGAITFSQMEDLPQLINTLSNT